MSVSLSDDVSDRFTKPGTPAVWIDPCRLPRAVRQIVPVLVLGPHLPRLSRVRLCPHLRVFLSWLMLSIDQQSRLSSSHPHTVTLQHVASDQLFITACNPPAVRPSGRHARRSPTHKPSKSPPPYSAHVQLCTRSPLKPRKWLVFEVIRVRSLTYAIAAICPSTNGGTWPTPLKRARSRACQSAASRS